MKASHLNIVIGGEAGQGLVTIGDMLGKVLVRKGYCLHVTQSYQSRIRGGHNTYALRTGTACPAAPLESIDLLVALDAVTPELHAAELSSTALILSDDSMTPTSPRHICVPGLPSGVSRNTAMFGILGGLLGLERDDMLSSLRHSLSRQKPDVVQANEQSLLKGLAWLEANRPDFPTLAAPALPSEGRLMLNCHEALALGALSAGLKFYAFYPMSPSTSIAQALGDAAPSMGVIMEQGEDEIAVINMALGAAYAGAPSMVGTSGGGFALMVEGVSLAGMTETPLVIVVAMRPGPATGLPTRTEQADLNLVLYAGHGEFPRAIFAPGTPEQCFHLTRRAFVLAERHQGPVFILTDQYLSDSARHCEPFDLSPPALAISVAAPDDPSYQRYTVTENGVSPRAIPGQGEALVVLDSDEHTPDGHLTEDLAVRERMQNKRMAKLQGLLHDCLPPDFSGPEAPDVLLICWGSTVGAVLEAADSMRAKGLSVGVCHFTQLWPLRPEDFKERLNNAGRVVMVESNFTGQFAALLHNQADFRVHASVLRYDGLPMTARYILENLDT